MILPLTLIRTPQATSNWKAIQVQLQIGQQPPVRKEIHIRVKEHRNFKSLLLTPEILLMPGQQQGLIGLRVANTGNITSRYEIKYQNQVLQLYGGDQFTLEPGKDTIWKRSLTIDAAHVLAAGKQKVNIQVGDDAQLKAFNTQLQVLSTHQKFRRSAHGILPMTFANGYLYNGRSLTYYFALGGSLALASNKTFTWNFRSRQFGVMDQLVTNAISFGYATPKLKLNSGQMISTQHFIAFGNGLNADIRLGKSAALNLQAIAHNKHHFFKNDMASATVHYGLGNMQLHTTLAFNRMVNTGAAGMLLTSDVSILRSEKLSLGIRVGAGREQGKGVVDEKGGLALGYQFSASVRKLKLSSNLQKNGLAYPGMGKGLFNHDHRIGLLGQKLGSFLYYQFNQSQLHVLRDSLFNTDFLQFNSRRAGANFGFKGRNFRSTIGGGYLQQNGFSSTEPGYLFTEFTHTQDIRQKVSVNVNTLGGRKVLVHDGHTNIVWMTNSSLGFRSRYFGLHTLYTLNPISNSDKPGTVKNIRTMRVSPSFYFRYKSVFSGSATYSLARITATPFLHSYMAGRLKYSSRNGALSAEVNASMPVNSAQAITANGSMGTFVDFSLISNIGMPLFWKRKYVDLEVQLFHDTNHNGRWEQGEGFLPQVRLEINGRPYITDDAGKVVLENTDKGAYALDIFPVNGLVPAGGQHQNLQVKKSMAVQLAFKASKKIIGLVQVQLDSLAHTSFTPEHLKVTISDSTGVVGYALTNKNGQFELSVPSGIYQVALNPEAFDDKLKPRQMSFEVDLRQAAEATLRFVIEEKKRKVRIVNF